MLLDSLAFFFFCLLKSKINCLKIWAKKILYFPTPPSLAVFYLIVHLFSRDVLSLFHYMDWQRDKQNLPQGLSQFFSPGLLFYLLLTCCIALCHWLLDSPAPVLSHTSFRSETRHCICSTWGFSPACLLTYSCAEALMHTHLTELSSKQDPLAATWASSLPW